eukprot:jgi/Ulvmu1/1641/UM114_0007.1
MNVLNVKSSPCVPAVGRRKLFRGEGNRSRRLAATRAQAADASVELPQLLDVDGDFPARHSFSGYANWLVPGYVMVGQYPFIHGSACKTHDDGEARLQQILQAGITAFASALVELPPQEKMPIGGVEGFVPYKPTADLIAAGLSGPPPSEIVEGLRNPYLDKFVPPRRREASAAYQAYKPIMPKYLTCPLSHDFSQNNVANVAEFVGKLDETLKAGERLYIHCIGGSGRSGVLAASLLVRTWGVTPEEAMARLEMARNLRGDAPEGKTIDSPSSPEQVQFVRDVCAKFM